MRAEHNPKPLPLLAVRLLLRDWKHKGSHQTYVVCMEIQKGEHGLIRMEAEQEPFDEIRFDGEELRDSEAPVSRDHFPSMTEKMSNLVTKIPYETTLDSPYHSLLL